MNLTQFRKRTPGYYKSGVCVYLTAAPGRGKTTTVLASVDVIGDAMGFPKGTFGFKLINGANVSLQDFNGYLIPRNSSDSERAHCEWTAPDWYKTDEGKYLDEYPNGGILFIDEADKMEADLKKIAGEGAESGRFGPHLLPPGWVVWMAGNRATDRSGSTKEFDHLINRRLEIPITDDIDSWVEWAFKNDIDPTIITFAKQNINIIYSDGVPEKQGPWCTPRSLVKCAKVLQAFATPDGKLPVDPLAVGDAAGTIGHGAAAQLFATIRLAAELPELSEIIAFPKDTKLPGKPDAQMLVCYNLASRVDEDNVEPLVQYIERMPKEFGVTFIKAAVTKTPMLVETKTIAQWCTRNASIMQAIADAR